MFFLGPNYQHLFTAREVLSNVPLTDTASLVSHIIFYFNAKVNICNLKEKMKAIKD